ncbi:helix-turn-helix transcriptional regulator [Solwaraspora sp. WMMD791]|uniref:helix-turn-helix domain-containing protein n=1 Tax=Solwaraspora sp. WMMD791 TaxID=3016086 RepID=UPI00249C09C7|nr:helix-turn-helix transcriptional regulator [Solwaraspora sp. WMMD791]WFE26326.1 helix-turn-helix transcriptional regulator [Solwaraspora sp. WMMD791]
MAAADDEQSAGHRVVCHLDRLLAERRMTLTELAERAGVTVVNLSVLKNDRARAVRFSTLTAICDVLRCQPGDLFSVAPPGPAEVPDPPGHPSLDGIR